MATIKVRNQLKPSEEIKGVTVTLSGPGTPPVSISKTTPGAGTVTFDTSKMADGAYTITLVPAATLSGAVDSATASSPTPPDRIFRQLTVDATMVKGKITAVSVAAVSRPDGAASVNSAGLVTVDLQPVWMKSPNHSSRGTSQVSMIIVHHTGGPVIGPAISTFLSTGEGTSSHFLINTDGQVLKMVQDTRRAHHAGEAHWDGQSDINSISIGIEIVNSTGAYPAAQMTALLDLIAAIRAAHPTINDWNIIGHSDIATSSGKLGRKSSDPGSNFEWSKLEGRRFGMLQAAGPGSPSVYAGFFSTFSGMSLRKGDNDTKRIFGAAKRGATFTGNPVRELQDDLVHIGYHLGTPDGDFGDKTRAAVQMFQEHFFAGGRGHKSPDGQVDLTTAQTIKSVSGARP